jgi:hypothetical protein
MADVDRALQVERFDELREVVCVCVRRASRGNYSSSGLWRTSVILREAHYKWENMMVALWLFNTNNTSPNNY